MTGVKTFGVTSDVLPRDRPHVFVKIETDAGVVGWGEATLEGKAGAAMQAVHDFSYAVIGQDPMHVEHHWQSMYIHAFYRSGPVLGSAISGIDQALWDIRGKVLGKPVYELLGGPLDDRGVRGYYHLRPVLPPNAPYREQVAAIRERAEKYGVTAFKTGIPGYYEWIDTHQRIKEAIDQLRILREVMGDQIDIGVDFHAKTSAAVALQICREVEDLNLMFVEEPCPPENVKAMKRISDRTTVPIATGERLITHYGCRELIEGKVVDILQTDVEPRGRHQRPLEGGGDGRGLGGHDGAARLRRPGGSGGLHPRRRGDAELPGAGDLQRRRARRKGRAVAGAPGLSRHAHGQRVLPAAHQAGPGHRSRRAGARPPSLRGNEAVRPAAGPRRRLDRVALTAPALPRGKGL